MDRQEWTRDEAGFLERYRKLSPESQAAAGWILYNMEFFDELTGGRPIPKERLERYLEDAEERKDTFAVALMLYKAMRDRKCGDAETGCGSEEG